MSISPNEEMCANLTHNLNALRRQYGLTKKVMARLLGISLYSLNLLENGKIPSRLGVEILFRAHSCFGISIQDLFRIND